VPPLSRTTTPGFTSEGQRLSGAQAETNIIMPKTKTVLLIDGDVFIYQIGLAAERATHWGDDLWTLHADAGECKRTLDDKLETLKRDLLADEIIVALSCPTVTGFRRALCPTYKSNRNGARKPIVHVPLREYLLEKYDTILKPNLEADDVLGILATQPTADRRIIVSVDKDFSGVPCNFYRMLGDNPQVVTITREQAARFHALQTLTGDRTDGYVGVPGCGPKTAEKVLDGVHTDELWPAIVKAYADAGLSEEVALTTARLARILQYTDYDTKTGEVKLWLPQNLSRKTSPDTSSSATPSSKRTTFSPSSSENTSGQQELPGCSPTPKADGTATGSTENRVRRNKATSTARQTAKPTTSSV
jgi:5'-3' exonuclease